MTRKRDCDQRILDPQSGANFEIRILHNLESVRVVSFAQLGAERLCARPGPCAELQATSKQNVRQRTSTAYGQVIGSCTY